MTEREMEEKEELSRVSSRYDYIQLGDQSSCMSFLLFLRGCYIVRRGLMAALRRIAGYNCLGCVNPFIISD